MNPSTVSQPRSRVSAARTAASSLRFARSTFGNFRSSSDIASATVAGRRRLYSHAIDNALNVLAGRPATIVAAPF